MPAEIRRGDTLKLRRSYGDYLPSDSWTLYLAIGVSGEQAVTFIAADDNDTHLFTIDGSSSPNTESLALGPWRFVEYVEKGNERFTLNSDYVTITPDLTKGDDCRTFARIALEKLEAVITERIPQSQVSMSIGGRSIALMGLPEMVALRNTFRAEVAAEEMEAAAEAGLGHKGKIVVSF